MDGRLRLGQPLMFVLGPAALLLALIAPYQGLFVIAYSYMLLVLVMYLWVREVGPRVRLRRRLQPHPCLRWRRTRPPPPAAAPVG